MTKREGVAGKPVMRFVEDVVEDAGASAVAHGEAVPDRDGPGVGKRSHELPRAAARIVGIQPLKIEQRIRPAFDGPADDFVQRAEIVFRRKLPAPAQGSS